MTSSIDDEYEGLIDRHNACLVALKKAEDGSPKKEQFLRRQQGIYKLFVKNFFDHAASEVSVLISSEEGDDFVSASVKAAMLDLFSF